LRTSGTKPLPVVFSRAACAGDGDGENKTPGQPQTTETTPGQNDDDDAGDESEPMEVKKVFLNSDDEAPTGFKRLLGE